MCFSGRVFVAIGDCVLEGDHLNCCSGVGEHGHSGGCVPKTPQHGEMEKDLRTAKHISECLTWEASWQAAL